MIQVIVMRNKQDHDRYLAANMDVGDWEHENLDVTLNDVASMFMIVRNDLQPVTEEDYQKHVDAHLDYKKRMIEKYGDSAFISMDFEKVLEAYEPMRLEITQEQYEAAKENWEG